MLHQRQHAGIKSNKPKPAWLLTAVLMLIVCMFSACGNRNKTEVILTTNFKDGEVFRIEKSSCYLPEVMVYLVNSENSYDEIFGEQIWSVPLSDSTVGEAYKETI